MATELHPSILRRAWRATRCIVMMALTACAQTPTVATASYTARVVNPDLVGGLRLPHSGVVLLWGSDGSILRSSNARDWTYATTPIATDLVRIASDDTGRVSIGIGKQGAVLRSDDAGRSWRSALNAGANIDFKTVAYHAASSTWLIAGTHGALLRSRDAGATWTRIALPLGGAIETLFVDPTTQAILLGADDGIVGRSTDAGATWELTQVAMPVPATPITRFIRSESRLFALSALGRLLTSDDDADTWSLVQTPTRAYFTDAAVDPRRKALVMIGHDATILRTIDQGRSWSASVLTTESSRHYLSAIRFDAASRSLILVGHGGTMARSDDAGATWSRVDAGTPGNFEGVVSSDTTLTAFGSGGSILTSSNAGRAWRSLSGALGAYLRDVAQVPGGDATIATGQLGEILRSEDGVDWQRIAVTYPDAHTPPDLRALTPSASGDALLAAGPPGAILRSSARGERWEILRWNPLDAGRAYPWILKDHTRKALVTLDARGAMQVSADDGIQWREIDAQIDGELWHGAVLEHSGVMIAAGQGGVVARSEDSGASWTSVRAGTNQDLFGSYADEPSASVFLMGQSGTLLRSTDGGHTWRGLSADTRSPLRRMIRDAQTGALICFGGNGVILRSEDGDLWQRVDSGVDAELRKAIVDPGDGALLIAGRNGVVLRSHDGGRQWERLPTHTLRHFTSIAARPNGDLIVVGERIVHFRRTAR